MTYNDMPVIIPLLATGYLLTIYLLLILAQRTIKSSRYVADSLTDAYASYVPTEQAPHTDDVEQWSRTVQRSTTGRWTRAEPNSSATYLGATAVTSPLREPPPFGQGFAQRGTPNIILRGTAAGNGNAEQETLQETANSNTQEKDGSAPSKTAIPEL